ncbi:MAG: hypothetical protein ABJQ70_03420 [Roseobacter sp.]
MKIRLLTFALSFFFGFLIWFGIEVSQLIAPQLSWDHPILRLFMGMSFPGGAPPELHFINHIAQTWCPFLLAYITAYVVTKRRARLTGALVLYGAFLLWSLGMLFLAETGVSIGTVFNVGLLGTVIGGAYLYLRLVDPLEPPA